MIPIVRVFAPATVANVASGFDILGFAINEPGDEVVARASDVPGVRITRIDGDGGKLPYDEHLNTAGVAALQLLLHVGCDRGIEIELHKHSPLGSGLGSSASSGVAGVVAANELLGRPLARRDLLPFAMEGERVACGAAHADNVAPALLGGFVLIRSYNPLDVVSIPAPSDLYCTVVHPHVEIRTEDARRILKSRVPLRDAVVQWGNTAGLIAGLMSSDYDLIGRSIQDVIVEPMRSVLIPGFAQVKDAARGAGALGCSISGSGPTIFALSKGRETADRAGAAMGSVYRAIGIGFDIHVSAINREGARALPCEMPA